MRAMAHNTIRPIEEVARSLDIRPEHVHPYGRDKAKIDLRARGASERPPGKLVLVSAITPTSAGEGKTVTSISLGQGLAKIGERVCVALREPSLGPTFGIKGGATGGGKALLVPAMEINLHFTGDFHAISAANNLLAAALDNHLHHGNDLGIDPRRVVWRRVIDLNDRALRNTLIGLGGPAQSIPRETGFDITPASEVMAALCLSEDEDDLRARLSRIVIGQTYGRELVLAHQLQCIGALMVILRDAIKPNLVQTVEGVPVMVHGGPFANIAHGCNSVIATKTALAHADWVVTEAGFGFDLGGEKFFDIKCRSAGLNPVAVVVVATIKALKLHGGVAAKALDEPNSGAVEKGLANLEKHVENVRGFDKAPIVTLNHFPGDTEDEIAVVRAACERMGCPFAVHKGFEEGGEGVVDLARLVVEHAEKTPKPFRPTYELSDSLETKMEKVATGIYGAAGVDYTAPAQRALKWLKDSGYGELPLCVAKTPASFSDVASNVGRPTGFRVTVSDVVLAAGAGFVVPILGSILRMPGLPKAGQLERIDLVDGEIVGLR